MKAFKLLSISILLLILYRLSHYLFLWMEKKGWIYYKTKSKGGGVGNSLLEMEALFRPSAKNVIERKYEKQEEESVKRD